MIVRLKQRGTTGQGRAWAIFEVDDRIEIGTSNNEFGEAISEFKTLIEGGTSVYDTLAYSNGDALMRLTGQFKPSEQDFVYVSAITERGAMTRPSLELRIDRLERVAPEEVEAALNIFAP